MVKMDDAILTDTRDIVAAFDDTGNCLGTGHIEYSDRTDQALLYLTIYGDNTTAEKCPLLTFRLWHYNTGKTMVLSTPEQIKFQKDTYVGTVKNPVVMTATDAYIQSFHLEPGWNWISFNVYDKNLMDVAGNEWVPAFPWANGDIITSDNMTLSFSNGKWNVSPSNNIDPQYTSLLYRVFVNKAIDTEVTGQALKTEEQRTITVKKGWNGIGYTPMTNLPVSTALADYWSNASDGDIIKSQHEFAIFTEGANGTGEWTGSLRYMKPGEGYMLYRQNTDTVTFRYPYVEPGATIGGSATMAPRHAQPFSTTMTLVARTADLELQEGDRLVAYCGGEKCGEATVKDSLFFMSINEDIEAPVTFAIERQGDIIAVANETMTYIPDANSGTPQQPTQLHFVNDNTTPADDSWYSIYGYKLNGKPLNKGIYINNGKKRIIK